MAKVLLHSVALDAPPVGPPQEEDKLHQGKWMQGARQIFIDSALQDPFGVHTLTDNPDEADLIIFPELGIHGFFAEWVRYHPYFKKYREKCFIFETEDASLPLLPGLYASLRQSYASPSRTRTGYYLRIDENPYIDYRPAPDRYDYLACFVGSFNTHPVRASLARIASNRILIEDTSAFSSATLTRATAEEKRQSFWPRYADLMASGAFSLCPRGRGTGSVRLFETMRMGRCPVIISDEWVYPERVDWASCSLTLRQKDVDSLPEFLEENLPRAPELGRQARQQWEKFYGLPVRFHWLVEDCLAILQQRRVPEAIVGRLVWRHLVHSPNLLNFLRAKTKLYRQTGKLMF